MSDNNVQTAIDLAFNFQNKFRASKSKSLIEYTKPSRVEPIVLIDRKLANLSFMPDVMQSLNSIFAAYYLQAISLMVNVGKVDVISILDSANPNRDPYAGDWKGGILSTLESKDSYDYGLPVPNEKIGLEAFGDVSLEATKDEKLEQTMGSNKNTFDGLRAPNTLAVGKMLDVEISSDGQKASFPVSVKMIPVMSNAEDIVRLFSIGFQDTTFMGRIHAWKSGRIDLMKDLILCQDLIDNHRKGLSYDNTGIYKDTIKRSNKNFLSTLLSGYPSVATASNIMVISDATAKQVEKEIGGKLKRFKTREKLFDDTAAMLLVVINPDWEAITIYHRSVDMASELSAGDVKQMGKKEVDVGEILKAYQLGNAPSF